MSYHQRICTNKFYLKLLAMLELGEPVGEPSTLGSMLGYGILGKPWISLPQAGVKHPHRQAWP